MCIPIEKIRGRNLHYRKWKLKPLKKKKKRKKGERMCNTRILLNRATRVATKADSFKNITRISRYTGQTKERSKSD